MRSAPAQSPPRPALLDPGLGTLLIVGPGWIGDTVMATPLLRAARARCPDTRLVVAVRAGLEEVLAGLPEIDEILPVRMAGWRGPIATAAALARGRPRADAVLLLPNSLRSAITTRLARIPIRIGYVRNGRGRLLTHGLPVEPSDTPTSMIRYYERLAAFAFGPVDAGGPPILGVTDDEQSRADRILADVDGPFVVLGPGASKTAKRWPTARFAAVADRLAAAHGLRTLVTGAPAERDLVAAVVAAARTPAIDLAARGLTLGPAKAVLRRAQLVVTNDTGTRHLAAAVGTPVVTLFGPTDHRWTTLEGLPEHRLLAEPFLPETRVADASPRLCGIDRIPIADVLFAAGRLLAEPRPPVAAAPFAP